MASEVVAVRRRRPVRVSTLFCRTCACDAKDAQKNKGSRFRTSPCLSRRSPPIGGASEGAWLNVYCVVEAELSFVVSSGVVDVDGVSVEPVVSGVVELLLELLVELLGLLLELLVELLGLLDEPLIMRS